MNWLCPSCGRAFKHKKQAHSCVKVKPEDLFVNTNPYVINLFEKLKKETAKIGKIKIHSSHSTINFTGGGTFMVVKPRKDRLETEIISDVELIVLPVYKSMQFSKNRFSLFVRIETEDDISRELLKLLKKAYMLSKK
ncbi:MAG TPA: DUF5655 domain-containing protein [Ignavibacteria bacterium]|nr:DUF5655 domain-containing protein [Ignavibacteria bacterium]